MNIGLALIVILLSALGIGTTVIIIGYMLLVIAQKIYRKLRFNTPLTK